MPWRKRTHGSPKQVGKSFKTNSGRVKGAVRTKRYSSRPKVLTYRVYGEPSQTSTTVDITNTASPDIYNKADEVLHKRFGKRIIRVNHAGRTIKLKEWDEDWG